MYAYVDSSALIKRYTAEDWSDLVIDLFQRAELVATAAIAHVEVSQALFRMQFENRVSRADYGTAIAVFQADWHDLVSVTLNGEVLELASRLAGRHVLKSVDLVHVAAALIWKRDLDEAVTMATFDLQLWHVCSHVALEPWPPDLPALCAARRHP